MTRALLLALIPIFACNTTGKYVVGEDGELEPYTEHDEAIEEVEANAEELKISEQCNDRESPPGYMTSRAGRRDVEKPCGLIIHELMTETYLTEFVNKVCGEEFGAASKECGARFLKTFLARMAERYFAADFNAIRIRCDAYPIKCADSKTLELWALESHNQTISHAEAQQVQQLRDNKEAAQGEELREAVAGFATVMEAMLPQKWDSRIACQSDTLGSTTTTDCKVFENP